MTRPDPHAFAVRREAVRNGMHLSFVHEGVGGVVCYDLALRYPERCRVAFPECIGPFVLRDCGHFVQWEQAEVLNTALTYFCKDLLSG